MSTTDALAWIKCSECGHVNGFSPYEFKLFGISCQEWYAVLVECRKREASPSTLMKMLP